MEHQLLLASLGLALIVAVGASLLPAVRAAAATGRADATGPAILPAEIAAALLPFLGFLLTLPSHAPFAGGQGLGRGFLIGGLAAFALGLAARRTGTATAGGAALALPVVAVALPLLLLRPVLLDALFGVAIGAFATTFLLLLARRSGSAGNTGNARSDSAALLAGVGVTLTLAAAGVLGTLRDPRTASLPRGTWAVLALAFTAGGALAVLLAEAVRGAARPTAQPTAQDGQTETPSSGRAVGAAVSIGAIGLCGILAALLGTKLADGKEPKSVIATLLIGLILTPLIGWLFHARAVAAIGRPVGGRLLRQFGDGIPFLAILVLVVALMVGGQLLQGYGFALALLAVYVAWAVSGGASTPRHDELRLLLFGTALVLYRTFLARWSDDLHGVNLSDQYALFGLVVGAAAPHLVAALTVSGRRGQPDGARPLLSSTVAGLLSLAIPGAAVLIFGPKCALALILGAALSGVFAQGTLPILLTLAMALALDQWNGHLLPYADIARLTKIKALAVVFAVVIAAVAVAAGTAKDTNDINDTEGTDSAIDDGDGL